MMKYKLLIFILLAITSPSFSQNKSTNWNATIKKSNMIALDSRMQLPENTLFNLNLTGLKTNLNSAPTRKANSKESTTVVSIPNADGVLERYRVYENSNMDPALAARYPEIKSYIGIGIDNPTATAYFSVSPLGFKSMVLSGDKSAVFIEPISADLATYTVYRKADKAQSLTRFECSVIDEVAPQIDGSMLRPNADDALLRTFRLAMSCTGEYAVYFGGTKALALAAINNSITRCNGVFEKDFGARLIIIANTDLVIYTDASTDPYSASSSMSQWNAQLQSTLTSVIGEANYDIGHLFGATGGGGNAGCIGCICVDGSKGSGITSPTDGIPSGDNFDIDYVAHEIGHQMGANHTWTHGGNEGTGVQMEPGSGSTIMGYAGITSLDVQPHSDAYFHAISIQQVTNNIKTKTCSVNIATGNAIPTVSAGLDYTIPKSTPFMLTATATDANGDALTYNWEEMDSQTTAAVPSATKTTGVNFRSYTSTTSPTRYFPRMASVLTGATTTAGSELTVEALSSVARTLNFRITVRDNRSGGPANNSDDMVVTVNVTAGPFSVTAPNTAVSYAGGSTQTIIWDVAGTTSNNVNCANVDILLSTDAGVNWLTLVSATPNDGTEAITIPSTTGTTNRIMVKGTNHIFFDVSNTNFTITPPAPNISSLSAASVCVGSTFIVTGTNLNGATAVTIGGTAAASYVVNSASQITVTAGFGTTGTVAVTTASGTGTSSASININALPTSAWAASTANVCQSASAKTTTLAYSATTNSPTTYSITWSASPTNSFATVTNQTFTGTAGGGTVTINVPANANVGSYIGTITVANANGCVSSATQTFTVTVNATPIGTTATATPTTLCAGNAINLTSSYTIASVTGSSAAINAFNVIRTTGTGYTSIIPATTITTWRNSASTDDNLSNNQPIGFNFVYNNVSYTTFRVSTNGFVTFDNSSTATGAGASPAAYSYTNNWTIAGSGLIVAPNWDDLKTAGNLGTLADLNNSINYTTAGTTGSRILTVEWKNMRDFSATSTAFYNWQIKFYESDSHIEFVYGTMTQSAASVSYSLGLSAATVSGTPTTAELLSQTTVNTGTFGFTNQNSLATIPASNTTLSFYTPITPVYSWTGPTTFTSSVANPTLTSATTAASGVYNLVISNPLTGCQSAQASTSLVTVNARPIASITSGNVTICNGSSTTLSGTITASGAWTLTLSSGGGTVTGTGSGSWTKLVSPTTNGTIYTIASLADVSCGSIASDLTGSATVTVNARPVAAITSGNATICNGSSTTLSGTITASGAWTLTLSSSGGTVTGTGSGSWTKSVSPTTNGTVYSITTLTDVSCAATAANLTGTVTVTVNASTTGTTTATACNSYLWEGPLGNGQTYTASNSTATFVSTNVSGCTHTQTLNLTINNSTSSTETVTSPTCGTYTWSANNVTYTASGTYTYMSTNAAGCNDTKVLVLTINPCESVVTVKFNIQGYYDVTAQAMRSVLANQGVGLSSTDVDTVTIELHNATTYALVATTTAMLQTNGNAVATFSTAPSGLFYVVVKHRNAVQTWSSAPVTVGATPSLYDFTTAANKAYGDNMVMLETGVYGLYSGDINQDTNIDGIDFSMWESDYNDLNFGYYATDLNGDGNVDGIDFSIWEANYNNLIYSVQP